MKLATIAKILATGLAVLLLVFDVAAEDPIFVTWLVMENPGDETIREYWQRADAGELNPEELVDLGTMLFYRGWPSDAVGYFKQALDLNPELSEAWFRIGLVEHHSRNLDKARSGYKKCLKLQSGHAWANFYLGLLEEQNGESQPCSTTRWRSNTLRSSRILRSIPRSSHPGSNSVRRSCTLTHNGSKTPCPCPSSNRPRCARFGEDSNRGRPSSRHRRR